MTRTLPLTGLLFSLFAIAGCNNEEPLSEADVNAMMSAHQGYASAWLTNDPDRVMGTLTEDPVLLPSGMTAIKGTEAAREFWWPEDSPPSTIVNFELDQREAGGFGDVGYVRGSFFLAFTYEGELYNGKGEFLSLLRRTKGNTWKISHHMWNDVR